MDTSEGTAASSGYRDSRGRFTKGSNANPSGRPKKEIPPSETQILDAALSQTAMRLIDLTQSNDETIALQAIKMLYERLSSNTDRPSQEQLYRLDINVNSNDILRVLSLLKPELLPTNVLARFGLLD